MDLSQETALAAKTITPELLRVLDKAYPHVQPSLSETDRRIWMRVGQRDVINFLYSLYDRENLRGLPASVLNVPPT